MSPRAQKPPREEIVLSIGGVVAHLELAGAQPVFMEQLRARYGAFEMPAAPWVQRDISLRLTLDSAAPPGASIFYSVSLPRNPPNSEWCHSSRASAPLAAVRTSGAGSRARAWRNSATARRAAVRPFTSTASSPSAHAAFCRTNGLLSASKASN